MTASDPKPSVAQYAGTTWTLDCDGAVLGSFLVEDTGWDTFTGVFTPAPAYDAVAPIVDAANRLDPLAESSELAMDVADAIWTALGQHLTVTAPDGATLSTVMLWFSGAKKAIRFSDIVAPGPN